MKFCASFVLAAIAFLIAGCGESKLVSVAPLAADPAATLPTRAQPKLQAIKLWIGAEELIAEMALTGIQMQTGMMFRTNIAENQGMIFVLPFPQRASFWMKNCPESLSAAYITTDGVIQEIHRLEKENTNSAIAATDDIQFVLETKEGWFRRHNISTGTVVRTESGSLEKTFLRQK